MKTDQAYVVPFEQLWLDHSCVCLQFEDVWCLYDIIFLEIESHTDASLLPLRFIGNEQTFQASAVTS